MKRKTLKILITAIAIPTLLSACGTGNKATCESIKADIDARDESIRKDDLWLQQERMKFPTNNPDMENVTTFRNLLRVSKQRRGKLQELLTKYPSPTVDCNFESGEDSYVFIKEHDQIKNAIKSADEGILKIEKQIKIFESNYTTSSSTEDLANQIGLSAISEVEASLAD